MIEKAELFLELYGNSLIRQQTFDYLRTKCDQFIKSVELVFSLFVDYLFL